MNGDGSQQRYVSTIRMVIRPGTGAESSSRRAERSPDHTDSAPAADPPVFMEPLEDCCVDEGSDFCLRGVVTGSQPISVSWFHNGEVARFGNSSFDGREVRFVMRECLPEDAGAYSCSAENGWGKMSCSAAVVVRDYESIYSRQNSAAQTPTSALKNVTENGGTIIKTPQSPKSIRGCVGWSPVQSPATSPREIIPKKRANSGKGQLLRFENPPQRLEVKAGQTARLSCSFSCTPPVVSCWIRNKQQIVDNSEVWTENTEAQQHL
ncbi:myosin light chain kinase, smooth muscle-like isoform 1-T1 [Pholidichthys leucotaenia]